MGETVEIGRFAAFQQRIAAVIRSVVGVVLFLYFLGSNAMAPIRPAIFSEPLAIFHREVNHGVWQIVGVPVKMTRGLFGSSDQQNVPLRSTIAPGDEASDKRPS